MNEVDFIVLRRHHGHCRCHCHQQCAAESNLEIRCCCCALWYFVASWLCIFRLLLFFFFLFTFIANIPLPKRDFYKTLLQRFFPHTGETVLFCFCCHFYCILLFSLVQCTLLYRHFFGTFSRYECLCSSDISITVFLFCFYLRKVARLLLTVV